jgi:hypothetical protein
VPSCNVGVDFLEVEYFWTHEDVEIPEASLTILALEILELDLPSRLISCVLLA